MVFEDLKKEIEQKALAARQARKDHNDELSKDLIVEAFRAIGRAVNKGLSLEGVSELMTIVETKSRFVRLKPGDKVCVNTKWGQYHVGHAPEGGRNKNDGPFIAKPWAYLYTSGKFITADRRPNGFEKAQKLDLGEEFEIEGYGLHVLEQPRWANDDVVTVRLSDGFRSIERS